MLQRSDQLSARCGVGTASLQLLRHVSAARSGSAAAGACRPGAGEPLSPPSTGVGPSPPMGLARARCGFHPHPTLPALTASGKPSERIDCAPTIHSALEQGTAERGVRTGAESRQSLGARVPAHVREDSRLFSSSMEEGASSQPRHTARRRKTPVRRRRSPALRRCSQPTSMDREGRAGRIVRNGVGGSGS